MAGLGAGSMSFDENLAIGILPLLAVQKEAEPQHKLMESCTQTGGQQRIVVCLEVWLQLTSLFIVFGANRGPTDCQWHQEMSV